MAKRKTDGAASAKVGKTAEMANAYRKRRAKAQAKATAQGEVEVRRVEGLSVLHGHAAGIDIGSRSHWVCVGVSADKDADVIHEFSAYTEGLHEIVAYLRLYQVTTVAMESTGIYWIPLYELLEANGFEVLLVDPSYTKQVKGRPKTDRLDCQWIYRLHSVGLLAAAFRPDEKTCQLRSYLRQRANVSRYAGQHIQQLEKRAGTDEPEADGDDQRHHRRDGDAHHQGDPAGRGVIP